MKKYSKSTLAKAIASAALLAASSAANADVIVLDFEGVGNTASINDFYNGGTDSAGNSGIDYGISFNSDALGLIDADAGGSGNTANEPSGETSMFFLSGSAVLNYMAGFDTGFSFFYSSAFAATVDVYDGLNATGNLLATLVLSAQNEVGCSGDPNGNYCNWTAVGSTFAGTAMSVDFGGTENFVVYDDITFGSAIAGENPGQIPEPAGYALLALGLGLLAKSRKRKS